MVHTKDTTKTTFLACHARGHGGGHFSDLEFDTRGEAQKCIDERGENVGDEYSDYWLDVQGHMFVAMKVTKITIL